MELNKINTAMVRINETIKLNRMTENKHESKYFAYISEYNLDLKLVTEGYAYKLLEQQSDLLRRFGAIVDKIIVHENRSLDFKYPTHLKNFSKPEIWVELRYFVDKGSINKIIQTMFEENLNIKESHTYLNKNVKPVIIRSQIIRPHD